MRGNAKKLIGNQARQSESGNDADEHPNERHFRALTEHEPHHIDAPRTEGHPDADFMSALADQVGDHAVNSSTGKNERERREDVEKNH